MYFAKNVATIIFRLILGSVFSNCVVFYGDTLYVIIFQLYRIEPFSFLANHTSLQENFHSHELLEKTRSRRQASQWMPTSRYACMYVQMDRQPENTMQQRPIGKSIKNSHQANEHITHDYLPTDA